MQTRKASRCSSWLWSVCPAPPTSPLVSRTNTNRTLDHLLFPFFIGCLLDGLVYPLSMVFFGSFINTMNVTDTSMESMLNIFYFWAGSIVILGLLSFIESYFLALYAGMDLRKSSTWFREADYLLQNQVHPLSSSSRRRLH